MSRSLGLLVGVALALLLAVPMIGGALAVPLADTIAVRAFDGITVQDIPPASIRANVTGDVLVVEDTNTSDGVRPAVDLTLTAQLGGPIVVRANTTVLLGDPTANTVAQGNHSVVFYDPQNNVYRVWVPGSTYLSVSRVYAIPVNETARVELGFAQYEVLATPLAADKVISGSTSSTTDAHKEKVTLSKGASVTIQVVSDTGKHDVYIFKPSNPSYTEVEQATGKGWMYYSSKSDWKIWYPGTTVSFTAPEDGDYLVVVVPFTQPGSFQVNVAINGGSATNPGTPGDGGDNGSGNSGEVKGAITASSAAIAIIIIVVVALAAWFVILPWLGWRK